MNIIISTASSKDIKEFFTVKNLNFLASYYYCKSWTALKEMKPTSDRIFNWFYLDSGVHTARKKSIEIKINDLIDFYKKYQDKIDFVFNLDVGDWSNQLNNAKIMKSNGVPVIPIYHADMPLEYIERFAEINPYIAVSYFKMNKIQKKSDAIMANLDRIYGYLYKKNLINDIPIHLLGCEIIEILKRFPVFSIDSTTPSTEFGFGKVAHLIGLQNIIRYRIEKQKDLKKAIEAGFYDGLKMKRAEGKKGSQIRIKHAVKLRLHLEENLTQLWANRGVIWNNQEIYRRTH